MHDLTGWDQNEGAPRDALIDLEEVSPFSLPESYVSFLSASNGGEWPLSIDPYWLILYSAEEVVEIDRSGSFHEFFPDCFVIGGSGGGLAVALTADQSRGIKVVLFDMTNVDLHESCREIAQSFEDLLALLENRND